MRAESTDRDALEVRCPTGERRRLLLQQKPTVIGRAPSPVTDIWLADEGVSRRHAQLQPTDDGRWALQDLGSLNGTFVNGKRTGYAILGNGDRIELGESELTLWLAERPPEGAEPPEMAEVETMPLAGGLRWHMVVRYARLARRINRSDETGTMVRQLCEGCVDMCGAQRGAVCLQENGEACWQAWAPESVSPDGLPLPSRLLHESLSQESFTYRELSSGSDDEPLNGTSSPAVLLFPLRSAGVTHGFLYLETVSAEQTLSRQEAGLIRLACMEAASRLDHFRRAAAEKRLVDELRAAYELQQALLPRDLRLDARVEMAAINYPSVFVSGDYYDAVKITDDLLLFTVADAMGHGLKAALLATSFHAGFRVVHRFVTDLPGMYRVLSQHMVDDSSLGTFVTGVLGLLDMATGHLTMCNAGHEPPLRVRSDGVEQMPTDTSAMPFGILPEYPVTLYETDLQAGSEVLLLYTDGLTEVGEEPDRVTGRQQFGEAVARTAFDCLEEALGSVASASIVLSGGKLHDDVTLMALRWLGPRPAR